MSNDTTTDLLFQEEVIQIIRKINELILKYIKENSSNGQRIKDTLKSLSNQIELFFAEKKFHNTININSKTRNKIDNDSFLKKVSSTARIPFEKTNMSDMIQEMSISKVLNLKLKHKLKKEQDQGKLKE